MLITVTPEARLAIGARSFPCALGRGGILAAKREGDGATPAGTFPLRYLRYRADRLSRPATPLAAFAILPDDGWCDDPADAAHYNRPVRLPHPSRCERLWREDALYDLLVVLGHNDAPPVPGLGSAIFLHVARPGYGATEGCVALTLPHLLYVVANCGENASIKIEG